MKKLTRRTFLFGLHSDSRYSKDCANASCCTRRRRKGTIVAFILSCLYSWYSHSLGMKIIDATWVFPFSVAVVCDRPTRWTKGCHCRRIRRHHKISFPYGRLYKISFRLRCHDFLSTCAQPSKGNTRFPSVYWSQVLLNAVALPTEWEIIYEYAVLHSLGSQVSRADANQSQLSQWYFM